MNKLRGYYTWRWHVTDTIVFRSDLDMVDDEYARTQDCYRRFDECKQKAIDDLQYEIEELEESLADIRALKLTDVKRI